MIFYPRMPVFSCGNRHAKRFRRQLLLLQPSRLELSCGME